MLKVEADIVGYRLWAKDLSSLGLKTGPTVQAVEVTANAGNPNIPLKAE